jgi:hypothetical protein
VFLRRIGPDSHANGTKSAGFDGRTDIWELENVDFAIIGMDITDAAIEKLPPLPIAGRMNGLCACRAIFW